MTKHRPTSLTRAIGFEVRMEEEEMEGEPDEKERRGFAKVDPEHIARAWYQLIEERQTILKDEKLTAKDKLEFLEQTRKTIYTLKGGKITKTDEVVRNLLIFSGTVLIVLATLTVYAHLPTEITLAFVGTIVGGIIATISQKLSRL